MESINRKTTLWMALAAGSSVANLYYSQPLLARMGRVFGVGHAAVVAPDYERVLGELREAGFDPEPRREHWGAPRCFVRDPAGHRIEVMMAPPPTS